MNFSKTQAISCASCFLFCMTYALLTMPFNLVAWLRPIYTTVVLTLGVDPFFFSATFSLIVGSLVGWRLKVRRLHWWALAISAITVSFLAYDSARKLEYLACSGEAWRTRSPTPCASPYDNPVSILVSRIFHDNLNAPIPESLWGNAPAGGRQGEPTPSKGTLRQGYDVLR